MRGKVGGKGEHTVVRELRLGRSDIGRLGMTKGCSRTSLLGGWGREEGYWGTRVLRACYQKVSLDYRIYYW